MNRTNLTVLCITLLLCCMVGGAQSETSITNTQLGSTSASDSALSSETRTAASPEQTSKIKARLEGYYTDYKNAQWRYSWAYHFCIFGAAILSALAALLSKAHVKAFGLEDPTRRDNWTASLAAIAAILIAISSAGKLQESWQENKIKRYAVESLRIQLDSEQNPTTDELEAYGKRLALIIDPNTALLDPKTVSPKN